MKKIEKTITRDLYFVDIQAWYQGYMVGLKNWLDWGYSDTIFYVHDGYVDMMRIPEEHLVVFRDKVLEKMTNDPTWFISEKEKTSSLLGEIYSFFDQVAPEIQMADNKKLNNFYCQYEDYIERVMGPFIMAYWLPNWFEKDEKYSSKFANEITLSLQQRKDMEQVFPRGAEFIKSLMTKVGGLMGIEKGLEKFVSKEELASFLLENKLPSAETLGLRKRGFLFSKDGVSFSDNTNEDLTKSLALLGYELEVFENKQVAEIKGQSACRGIAKGIVRIVMSKDKISTLQVGEVLVTSMTTPEFLPAMQKSIAFVTDEGGITCHAAIVAREMNKPCIIGTKVATKILKDGDLVEVDADNGIVRVIK